MGRGVCLPPRTRQVPGWESDQHDHSDMADCQGKLRSVRLRNTDWPAEGPSSVGEMEVDLMIP